jgi:hypothetical protein
MKNGEKPQDWNALMGTPVPLEQALMRAVERVINAKKSCDKSEPMLGQKAAEKAGLGLLCHLYLAHGDGAPLSQLELHRLRRNAPLTAFRPASEEWQYVEALRLACMDVIEVTADAWQPPPPCQKKNRPRYEAHMRRREELVQEAYKRATGREFDGRKVRAGC